MGPWMHGGWESWLTIAGWHLLWLVALVGLLTVVVSVVVRSVGGERGSSSTAQEILAERYARGEIDTHEYQHRRQMLR